MTDPADFDLGCILDGSDVCLLCRGTGFLFVRRVIYAVPPMTEEQILALRPGDPIAVQASRYGPARRVSCNECAGLGQRPPVKEQPR